MTSRVRHSKAKLDVDLTDPVPLIARRVDLWYFSTTAVFV